jgi:Flp pilus assembly protein TadG
MNQRKRRAGYVLVLVVMLLVGIFAMAALVIDIGFARFAHRQMQTAVDAAALEGLRGEGDTSRDYETRQDAAEQVISWIFDNDLDASNGDDGVAGVGGQFGAGPLVQFTGGAGGLVSASQLMDVDSNNAAYKPVLQPGTNAAGKFRVAIQRGGAIDDSADLWAHGPAVPFLFARGSLLQRQVIANGIAVGANGTAQAIPAVKIGMPIDGFPGAVAIGYSLEDWNMRSANPVVLGELGLQIGDPVTSDGEATTLPDGYCSIFENFGGTENPDETKIYYVVGFGRIQGGMPLWNSAHVAPGNASCQLREVWASIDPSIRDDILAKARDVKNGLQVSALSAHR